MCQLSQQLTLCTCHTNEDATQLLHYWVLKRQHQQDPETYLVGETMMPPAIAPQVEALNIATLSSLLNTGQCFDKALTHHDGDLLELYFTLEQEPDANENTGRLQYSFVYQQGRWQPADADPFDSSRIDVQSGPIAHPFANNPS